jgi:hypothetical protein
VQRSPAFTGEIQTVSSYTAGTAARVNSNTSREQQDPKVISLAGGGYLVVWQSTVQTNNVSANAFTGNASANTLDGAAGADTLAQQIFRNPISPDY